MERFTRQETSVMILTNLKIKDLVTARVTFSAKAFFANFRFLQGNLSELSAIQSGKKLPMSSVQLKNYALRVSIRT